ncbi:hypothetical protein GGI05_005608 [Coemansia sp. RSA 2603]|nr:hypothetical protein GGI05_005608 [Coemansia sp. RSA 2603]
MSSLASSSTLAPTTTATTTTITSPFDQDTFFTDWVTPGLVSGLFVALIFVVFISIGVSWMSSIQTPKTMPSMKQKKTQ